MNLRLFVYGLGIWGAATIGLRFAGQHLLRPGRGGAVVILFAVSFVACAALIRRLCMAARLPRERWLGGAVSALAPTLVLDPFSSAFFPVVFPNMAPELAGVFGGWMLVCCAGGLAGASIGSRNKS